MKLKITIMSLIAISALGLSIRGMPPVHDGYMDSITRSIKGNDPMFMYDYYGSNCLNKTFFDNNRFLRYEYYLLNPNKHGQQIRAVGMNDNRNHVYDVKWNVVYYEFDQPLDFNIGLQILKWARGELDEPEQVKLQEKIQWRGLHTNSSYKDFALQDILGTIAVFYDNEIIRTQIMDFIACHPKTYDIELRRIIIASLMGMHDEFNQEGTEDIRILAQVYKNSAHDESKDTYYNVRSWLEATEPKDEIAEEYYKAIQSDAKKKKPNNKAIE